MNTQSLLDQYFEVAFSAPEGVKRLRELILNLAMRGLLVPQDPTAQPARELLREIEAEKERLIQAGKIKNSSKLPEILLEEIPYELPNNWEWVRLGNIGESNIGLTYKPNDVCAEGIPVLRSTNIQNGKLDLGNLKRVDLAIKDSLYVKEGDLLICVRNGSKDLVGKTALIENLSEKMAFGAFMAIFRSPINEYLLRFINSSLFKKNISDVSTTTINQITQKNLKYTVFPLPPLEEQKRIVEKVDRLMEQCDRLEQLHREREQKRIIVHAAASHQLLNAKGDRELQTAWEFLRDRFGNLYAVKENISELRKAILQLAVMGKLVPQDPNDPPASELLKEIQAEKQRLVKEGKIKKQRMVLKLRPDMIPYILPKAWEWSSITCFSFDIEYGTSKKACDDSSKVPVYRMGNIVDGELIDKGFKYIDPEIEDLPKLFLQKNDILFNRTNSYELVGKTALYRGESNIKTFASYLLRIRVVQEKIFPSYVVLAMNSPYFRRTQIEPEITQQCGQANFNGTKLAGALIPLPPLPEQHRIVEKVDQLMELCDQLESKIDQQTQTQTRLLNTLMAELN